MLEDESFSEFYTKITDLRKCMINLGKKVYDVKLSKKILRSLLERFCIKVTTTEESKDLDEMRVEELVGSLLTYELTLPPFKKVKSMLARKFSKLMKSKRFRLNIFKATPKVLNKKKVKLMKRILEVIDVLNVQVLRTSK
jgi:hypothetical protein